MELKRDEIIKALECCQIRHIEKNCDECYYHRWLEPTCRGVLCEDALALIKELTEENERLRTRNEALVQALPTIRQVAKADTLRKFLNYAIDNAVCKDNNDGTERLFVSIPKLRQITKEMLEESNVI